MFAKDYRRRPDIRRIIESLSRWVDLDNGLGLEIGPLDKPLVDRSAQRVKYVDYFDEASLKSKIRDNPNRDAEKIVKLDYVLDGACFSEAISEQFDYVAASHVLEHLPNLFRWLEDLQNVLKPGGVLFAVVPDCRYTFDIERPATSIGELVENYVDGRKSPAPRHAFDQVYYHKNVSAGRLWRNYRKHREGTPRTHDWDRAMRSMHRARKVYVDCHCNLFTPDSFAESIKVSFAMGLHRLAPIKQTATERGFLDFIALLKFAGPDSDCLPADRGDRSEND